MSVRHSRSNRWLRRHLPDETTVRRFGLDRYLTPRLLHPALWGINRRSVAGGFAAGLFCGLIPGPFQILAAGSCAVWLRVSLPVALVTTLYTNPLTIIPLYGLAHTLGAWATGQRVALTLPASATMADLAQWAQTLGAPLFVGLPLLAALLALSGYLLVRCGWSLALRWRGARRTGIARTG